MSETRLIKKYPNRRLYDTTLGEYITLDDVKKLVFDHVDFKVIDARSKKDLTQSTLLQIISEQEATTSPLFTTAMLQEFIRFYQEKSQNIFSKYLEQAMSLFSQQESFLKNQWQTYEELFSNPVFVQLLKKKTSEQKEGKKQTAKMPKKRATGKNK